VLAFNQQEANAELQQQQGAEAAEEEPELVPVPPPQLLARFHVNQNDTLAVFRAVSTEDFADVASLLPPNTALPAADKMTYLLARLEVRIRRLSGTGIVQQTSFQQLYGTCQQGAHM
jgi:hypothetical protein